jgi:DNA-binding SARP family transcriptional activator
MVYRFSVLGPLTVYRGDTQLMIPSAMHRRLLALLLSQANRGLNTETIAHELWQDSPPKTARKAIQVYVHQLRRLLGNNELIAHENGGYQLVVQPSGLDAYAFSLMTSEASNLRDMGQLAAAMAPWTKALALWRGPIAYHGVDGQSELMLAEREWLQEQRSTVWEERLAAALELGQEHNLLAGWPAIGAEHPYRERLHGLVMIAMYRFGRPAEALATYHSLRQRLASELGMDPTPGLQEIQRRILVHDPDLRAATI